MINIFILLSKSIFSFFLKIHYTLSFECFEFHTDRLYKKSVKMSEIDKNSHSINLLKNTFLINIMRNSTVKSDLIC